MISWIALLSTAIACGLIALWHVIWMLRRNDFDWGNTIKLFLPSGITAGATIVTERTMGLNVASLLLCISIVVLFGYGVHSLEVENEEAEVE